MHVSGGVYFQLKSHTKEIGHEPQIIKTSKEKKIQSSS